MPTDQERQARLAEISKIADDLGFSLQSLELVNDQQVPKSTTKLKEMVENADTYFNNLQEQADVAVSDIDAKAATSRAAVYQSQGAFLSQAVSFLEDDQPGVDPAKLASVQSSMQVFRDVTDMNQSVVQQVDQAKEKLYRDSIRAATGPVLAAQGFTPQEIDAFSEASTKQLMGMMADLKTEPGMAADLAGAMAANLQSCSTELSAVDPTCSKLHNAMGQAFNVSIVPEKDGGNLLKPALEGKPYGRFSLKDADAHLKQAAEKNNVSLTPDKMLHEQMSSAPVLQTGTDMTRLYNDPNSQKNQASDTFRVQSNQALDDSGSNVAFAKNQVGARVERLKAEGASKQDVQKAAQKEGMLIDTVAPLYGSSKAVESANHEDMEVVVSKKLEVLQGDASSLISRSVASASVDKALGMNCLAEEKMGLDENGKPIGISVGVSGAPMLKTSDDPMVLEEFLDIDYSEGWVQKGLSDLQVQDYITGQIDRHSGNIFIDPNSQQVKGIDNDLAFPVVDREEMLKAPGMTDKAVAGLPSQIHVDTADKIEALSPEELRKSLENQPSVDGVGKLEPAAIDGAVERLEKLQAHVKDLRQQGKLVTEFNKQTYEQAKAEQQALNPGGNLSQGKCSKASYIGTAVVEEAVTERRNKSQHATDHRTMVKEGDVKPRINEPFNAYKKGVQEARGAVLDNPASAPTPELADRISEGKAAVARLEQQLAEKNQDLQAVNLRMKNAARLNNLQVMAPLKAAYEQGSQDRQELLRQLKAAQQDLNEALDQAVEPQKPAIAHSAAAQQLGKEIQVEQTQQQKLAQAEERLEAAKTRQAEAQAAEGAGWDQVLDGAGATSEDLAARVNELDAANQELEAATLSRDEALAELQKQQQSVQSLEKQVVGNEAALQAEQHLQPPVVKAPVQRQAAAPTVQPAVQQPQAPAVQEENPGQGQSEGKRSVRDMLRGAASNVSNRLQNAAQGLKSNVVDRLDRVGGEQKLRDVDDKKVSDYKKLQKDLKDLEKVGGQAVDAALDGNVEALDNLDANREDNARKAADIKQQMAQMKQENPGLAQLDRNSVGQNIHSGVRDAAKSAANRLR